MSQFQVDHLLTTRRQASQRYSDDESTGLEQEELPGRFGFSNQTYAGLKQQSMVA